METVTFIRLSKEEILSKLAEQQPVHSWRLLSDPSVGTIDCEVYDITSVVSPQVLFSARKIDKEMEVFRFQDLPSALLFLGI